MFELVSAIQSQAALTSAAPWFRQLPGIATLLIIVGVLSVVLGAAIARSMRRPALAVDVSTFIGLTTALLLVFVLGLPSPASDLVFLASAIGFSTVAGNWIARTLNSLDHGWRLGLILAITSVAGLAVALNWPPRFGVDLRGGITIIGQLRQDAEKSESVDVKNMIPQLIARVDPSGTQEILIRALGTDKIEVVIPDVDMEEAMRIWGRLTKAGELKFRIVADRNYHAQLTGRASELLDKGVGDNIVRERSGDPLDNKTGKIIGRWYELGRVDAAEIRHGVIPFKFMPQLSHLVRNGKTKKLVAVQQFGGDPARMAQWADEQQTGKIEILCVEPEAPDDVLNVEGEHLRSASSGFDDVGQPAVHFEMNRDGKRRMGALTSRNRAEGNRRKLLAIISDGKLISAPSIESTITDSGIIKGRFSQKEVDDLVINLKAGKLEVALSENPISQDYQQSTIGEELKQRGVISCVVSLAVVIAFMCIYYRFCGIVASVVLMLNLLLVMAVVMFIKQPLTLTGLAGIVLTIGMSVDANVLIYERIREELKKGAALRMAIRNGYDRAMSTIVDSNVTTILTGLVLYVVGTEQLKGFSVTLILGILTSMFTAIFCSRVILELAERRRWITKLNMLSVFPGGVVDFIGRRRTWYAVSLTCIVIGMVGMFFRGPEIFDHDLRGGSTARIVLSSDARLGVDQVRQMLDKYQGRINDRETVQFAVAEIRSIEFPDRVFKVDSNIPIWDKPEPAPYKPIDQALVEVFGPQLMQLHVDYDPNQLVVSRVNIEANEPNQPPSNTVVPGDGSQPENASPPAKESNGSIRLPWAAGLALTVHPLSNILVQEPQSPSETKPLETPPTSAEAKENQETAPPPADAAKTDAPAEHTQETPTPPVDANQATISASERFVATTVLKFAQPISRGSLVTAIVAAAEDTGQASIEQTDVVALVEGKNPDDLSVKSDVWHVTLNIGRESDAKLILDSLQSEYNGKPYFPTISGVGGQIAAQTQWRALAAILASLVGIVMYVWIRFQNVAFGLGAVIALVHDVLVTLGAVALSYWLAPYLGFLQVENFRISLALIAAILTLIGYSINDTIVVFDRIREVRGKRPELSAEMINLSVSLTLSRTILTSTLTLLAVMVLYFMGGESIHGFAFALMIGIIVGTYSSIFIASPIALWLVHRSMKAKSSNS